MKDDVDTLLTAGTGYFGMGGSDRQRMDEIAEEGNFIKEGIQPAVEETDPNAERTAQCVKEHGEGYFYDPSLEMCSYRQE